MKASLFRISLLLICLVAMGKAALAQGSGVYVPKDGQVYAQDSVAIFSSLTNEGKMGAARNAAIYFFGTMFRLSGPDAQLPNPTPTNGNRVDGEGGNFIFQQPNPLTGLTSQQIIVGNYNAASREGSSFPSLTLNNPAGIVLDSSSLKVRETLTFKAGRLILNEQNLVVGHNSAGTILGYNQDRFVVTGTGIYGGYLIREKTDSSSYGELVYPIGADAAGYTPLAFINRSNSSAIGARVSNTVYSQLYNGFDLKDSTVSRTWEIAQVDTAPASLYVKLQHNLSSEGSQFAAARNQSFISAFNGLQWSRDGVRGAPINPGPLTTGSPLTGAGLNALNLELPGSGVSVYLTKFAYAPPVVNPPPPPPADTNKTRIVLTAQRLSSTQVQATFVTQPEVKNQVMYVQRRFATAATYSTIGNVLSKAPGGNSTTPLHYLHNDLNNPYTGLSYYRIVALSTTGVFSYSNEVAVPGPQMPNTSVINVWPVPTTGRFWVGVNGTVKVKHFNLYGSNGQLIRTVPVNGRSVIEMYEGIQGVYYIGFYGEDDGLITTKKLVVQN